MKTLPVILLTLLSSIVCAAQVSIDCEAVPANAVIAEIARQSGKRVTIAAPTDAKVTVDLSKVSVDEALGVVSGLCGGTFAKVSSGYRVYPKTSAKHVLGLMSSTYSKIKDIEVVTQRKAEPNLAGIETLTSRTVWRSTGQSRSESEHIVDGRPRKELSVDDGKCRWLCRSDSCHVEKREYLRYSYSPSIVTAVSLWGLPSVANPDRRKMPNLVCTGAEMRNGRPVYMVEYEREEDSEWYKAPKTGKWAPPSGQPGMYPGSGFLYPKGSGLEMQFRFGRPSLILEPPRAVATRCRFGVDAENGLLVFDTADSPDGSYEIEATDIREIAPGIFLPFGTRHVGSTQPARNYCTDIRVRVNVDADDSLFEYRPSPDVFVITSSIGDEDPEAALEKNPDDPDLLYSRAYSATWMGDTRLDADALRDYERALAVRPAARPCLLLTLLAHATDPAEPGVTLKYIAEVRTAMPNDAKSSLAIARAYHNVGMDRHAIEEFDRFCALTKNRAELPLCEMAQLCERLGNTARAERLYLEVLEIGGANECDQAVRSLEAMCASRKCLEALRTPVEAAIQRMPDATNLLVDYSHLLSKLGEPDAAMGVYRRLARTAPSGIVAHVIQQLKAAKDYKSVKEIAGTYLSRPDDSFGAAGSRNNGLIFSEMADVYISEGVSVPEVVGLYREFRAPCMTPPGGYWYTLPARQALRSIFTQLKVLPEAIETVETMWKADKTDTDLAYLLTDLAAPDVYRNDGVDPAICASAIRGLIEAWPDNPALYAMLGEILTDSRDCEGAAKAFARGLELSPNQPYYYTALAEVYSRMKQHDKALDLLRRLVARAPANDWFYGALGVAYVNAGQWEDAVDQFRKADELQQAEKIKGFRWEMLDALVRCYEHLGDNSSVERCMTLRLERSTTDSQRNAAMKDLAVFYAGKGQIGKCVDSIIKMEESGRSENSEYPLSDIRSRVPKDKLRDVADGLASALAAKPELFHCRMLLAEWYSDLKDPSSALAVLNDLSTRSWNDPKRLYRVWQIMSASQGGGEESKRILDRLMLLEPNKLGHRVSLMFFYQNQGRKDECVAEARNLMRYVRGEVALPNDSGLKLDDVASSVAWVYRDLGMYSEALDAYQLAIDLSPGQADWYRSNMAHVYAQGGDLETALAEYASIIRTSKDISHKESALRDSARLYERRQKKEEAVRCWKQLLSTTTQDSTKTEAQTNIDRLSKQSADGNG